MTQNKDPRNTEDNLQHSPLPDESPRRREVREAGAAGVQKNDTLLASPAMDDTAYWAPGAGPKELLMKHQMSGAQDAHTRWTVDEATKTITIEQETHIGKPFISTSLLTDLVLIVLHREGVVAYNDDNQNSWKPVRTDYKVFVRLGDLRLLAEVWQQMPFAGAVQSTIELYPVTEV